MSARNFYKTTTLSAVLALAVAGAVTAHSDSDAASSASLSKDDKAFIAKAAEGGMAEVAAGKLAMQKAQDKQVKDLGAKMVQDHTKAGEWLKHIAGKKHVTVPDKLDKSGEQEIDKVQKLSGSEFDKAYTKQQVSDHQKAIKAFEKEAKSGSDADLKTFASETLPTLREHLRLAQAAQDKANSENM